LEGIALLEQTDVAMVPEASCLAEAIHDHCDVFSVIQVETFLAVRTVSETKASMQDNLRRKHTKFIRLSTLYCQDSDISIELGKVAGKHVMNFLL
jgi:hypothetical protein